MTSSDHDSRLYAEKERIYSLIKDLESDLQSSKISEEDYNSLRNQYMSQAVEILKEIEDLPEKKRMRSHSLDEKVNQLIEQERGRKKTVGSSRKQ